ncbi:uncharacterized protein LOC101159593 isoform X3 [Oryzias latipes]|uniref:uncharacterized protein LOC101159593 isoform X3 n=1 Tax=Oryzias latipes TaxID=8090 RepID=UPI0009D9D1F6|nr:uncharacterized protein LOC101159593 isoform X3 [Oryzias latipes]
MRGCIILSASAFSACFVYVYIYRSHRLLKTHALANKLPSLVYLYTKYWMRVLTRKPGILQETAVTELEYAVKNCRLERTLFRRFCSAAGYGWDYPDAEFRDIPLCFPEFLCSKLLLLLLTDENFRLSPAGLLRMRQSMQTLQPVDELKKGPFSLQARVLGYRQTPAGVEVDIRLSATSRSGSTVWESGLTFLSESRDLPKSRDQSQQHHAGLLDEQACGNEKQVELQVPRTSGLQGSWSFSRYSLQQLFSLAASFLSLSSGTASSLWMLSVCLAEIEKHKGVEVITSPVRVTAHFKETLLVPGKVTVRFWEKNENGGRSSGKHLSFCMEQHGGSSPHLIGLISRPQCS